MKLLLSPFKFNELFSFLQTALKLVADDLCRYYISEKITVATKSGPVKGFKTVVSSLGFSYFNFIGIPYAKPPIGELRFKDPQPFEPSNEVINREHCHHGSLSCQAEILTRKIIGSEDCLHLSVYSRDIKPDKLKPVMLWIHGGVYLFGSNSKYFFNPEFLLRNDIVLVSINYRLGAFGFTSFKDPELGIPGNAGLKDQAMAMKWVKENCVHFGGDPDNITLFGESAGAVSVALHMVSNLSKDLFHKAILMSGSSYALYGLSCFDTRPHCLAKLLGWNGKGGDAACLKLLQQATPSQIVKVQEDVVSADDLKTSNMMPFGPVIEAYKSEQSFISSDPKDLVGTAWSKHVPVIIGSCSNEGLGIFKMLKNVPYLCNEENFKYLLPLLELNMDVEDTKFQNISNQMKAFYFDEFANAEMSHIYMKMFSDKVIAHGLHRTILSRLKYQYASTYLLRFDFDSPYSFAKRLFVGRSGSVAGACHGDDVSYYFRSVNAGPDPSPNTDEWKTIDRMCKIFTAFSATGDPNNDLISSIKWKPVTADENDKNEYDFKCLNIAKEVSYIDWPESKRMLKWDEIFKQYKYDMI